MNRCQFLLFTICMLTFSIGYAAATPFEDRKTLDIGAAAPDFNLPGVDSKNYTLASFKQYKLLVIVFTCNHCPTAQAYEDRIIQLTNDYRNKNVGVIAISPNDPKSVNLDELGYTDLSDSYEEMKIRATQKAYNFPYLYDGETQKTSTAYGPVATPHIFIFNKERKLAYQGRIDNMENPKKSPSSLDARNAIDALLSGNKPAVPTTKVFGCSVKWAEKKEIVNKVYQRWATEPVNIEMIDEEALKKLQKNKSGKLRLINIWATWCGPCVTEFPEFITINRMYRGRDFEFISISADDPANKEKVQKFLKTQQASNVNYLFSLDDKYKLIDIIDPKWPGALPYTMLVEPGGKIVYAKQGTIDPAEMKKMIVEHPLIGRYY